jgi:hypothetical protein
VSAARRNLKEAAGKALARRTEIAYEAVVPDEKADLFKVRNLHGRHGRICGGYKCDGERALPGEICLSAARLSSSRGGEMGRQKSAEGIVGVRKRAVSRSGVTHGVTHLTEGPNVTYG